MRQEEIDIIYEKLAPEQKSIWDCIGAEAYLKLVKKFGGASMYIAKNDTVERLSRNEKIRSDFNGYNFRYLAMKYNLAERTIRDIVSDVLMAKKNEPPNGQLSFDDLL